MSLRFYRLKAGFIVMEVLKLALISILIAYTFFDVLIAAAFIFPLLYFVFISDMKKEIARQREQLWNDYKNAVVAMAGNLGAGYSLENAFIMGLSEVACSESADVLEQYVNEIKNSLACNVPLENILGQFSAATGIDDIKEFSELIIASRRYGGNIVHIARRYAASVSDRQRLQKEIETMTASKRLEGRLMMIAPFVVVIYMRFTNAEYMFMLYHTLFGRCLMVLCLLATAAAVFITNKIIRIEV